MSSKTCKCGEPSLTGFISGVSLCQYHYDERMWGKDWADYARTKRAEVATGETECTSRPCSRCGTTDTCPKCHVCPPPGEHYPSGPQSDAVSSIFKKLYAIKADERKRS